jgi:hypothetical protein
MSNLDEWRMDKTHVEVGSLDDEPDDVAYWLSQPVEKRFEAIEFLRQVQYGYDPATERLQRVISTVKREPR